MDGLTRTGDLVFVLRRQIFPGNLMQPCSDVLKKGWGLVLIYRRASIPWLLEKTEGYSGSDIQLVCKEVAMQPLRRLMALLEEKQAVVPEEELLLVGQILLEDIETALRNTRPSSHLHAPRYEKFNSDYGSQILQ